MHKREILYSVDNGVRRKLLSKSHKVCVGNCAAPMAGNDSELSWILGAAFDSLF